MAKPSSRKRKKRKIILFVIEIIILVIVAGALFFYNKLDNINSKKLDGDKIQVNEVTEETMKEFEGTTTIACFGLDNRTQGVYTNGNSDVMIIMNINNETKKVSMVSLYRDTYLNVAGVGESAKFRKANAAYAYGGAEGAINMLNQNLDLSVDNYVSFDFNAVAEAIDILGGVDIEITSAEELKWVNFYIGETNKILDTEAQQLDGVGEHTLDGVQAVAYSRVRYTSGGDYKRTKRQRLVLNQMMEKAKKANLSQINELMNKVFPDIETDLDKSELISMVYVMAQYDIEKSSGFPYDKTTMDHGSKGSIVVPCDLETNVTTLHQKLFGVESYSPSSTVKEYSDYIINDTGKTVNSAVDDDFSDTDDFDDEESDEDSSEE